MITKLITTGDGSHTLYVPAMDEHYHSRFGAKIESEHIFIKAGSATLSAAKASILEIGFGTGLNALLTALFAESHKIHIEYTALEKVPVDEELVTRLNYGTLAGKRGPELFSAIHSAPWNSPSAITEWFNLEKKLTDLTTDEPTGT